MTFLLACRHVTLSSLISHHKLRSSFEEFATLAYSPAPLTNLFVADSSSTGSGSSRLPAPPPPPLPATAWGGGSAGAAASAMSSRADPTEVNESQTSPRNLKKLTANIKATLQGHPTTQKRASVSAFEQVAGGSSSHLNTNNNHQTSGTSPTAAINQAAVNLHSRLKRN